MKLKVLVGNGKKIGALVLPFLLAGVALNILFPTVFAVCGPPLWLTVVSIVILVPGVILWFWTVWLILTKIPKKELITIGPYALMKHPLYVGVALMVLPWAGFLLNTWLGTLIGIVVYIGSRLFSPEEEQLLSKIFGEKWTAYSGKVLLPWL